MAPLWFSSYVLQLRVPDVSLTTENIADFISAYIIGNLLQMAFRFWAFRRWVFPDEFGRDPDKAVESTFTAGGIAEAMEEVHEHHEHDASNVTPRQRGASNVTPLERRGVVSACRKTGCRTPRRRACRRLRDTAASGRAPLAECRGTPTGPVTPTR